ncbi:hypothetical protein MAPG_10295 [Magnaporthiopsis poae ATCC 64411]|uniref:Heterokaryon incompatibility domain-containing protein n=1 Tax=Magnaporthiopsis poae (strain ATCC 64411 / 73-15) TaxID=644358 RepID=A0A0C4EC81_MAGP6|nr:hypothetical protein MAPG_10295 [Magnaporthiopsis poae ATCC 64411]
MSFSFVISCPMVIGMLSSSHCRQPGPSPVLPTRIIDVDTKLLPTVDIKLSLGEFGEYLALSYCWGIGPHNYGLKKSWKFLEGRRSIFYHRLLKTIKDAIKITRQLGFRYLWVDALCVIQDDKDDWQRESARMSKVYSNAYCTISATGAGGVSEGCFMKRTVLDIPALPRRLPSGARLVLPDITLDEARTRLGVPPEEGVGNFPFRGSTPWRLWRASLGSHSPLGPRWGECGGKQKSWKVGFGSRKKLSAGNSPRIRTFYPPSLASQKSSMDAPTTDTVLDTVQRQLPRAAVYELLTEGYDWDVVLQDDSFVGLGGKTSSFQPWRPSSSPPLGGIRYRILGSLVYRCSKWKPHDLGAMVSSMAGFPVPPPFARSPRVSYPAKSARHALPAAAGRLSSRRRLLGSSGRTPGGGGGAGGGGAAGSGGGGFYTIGGSWENGDGSRSRGERDRSKTGGGAKNNSGAGLYYSDSHDGHEMAASPGTRPDEQPSDEEELTTLGRR